MKMKKDSCIPAPITANESFVICPFQSINEDFFVNVVNGNEVSQKKQLLLHIL